MKIVRFDNGSGPEIGVLADDEIRTTGQSCLTQALRDGIVPGSGRRTKPRGRDVRLLAPQGTPDVTVAENVYAGHPAGNRSMAGSGLRHPPYL
jgi:hypothetical protein